MPPNIVGMQHCFCIHPKSDILGNLKPITFTKHNYAVLVREAFAIYMSVKRHTFYLQDAECAILMLLGKYLKRQKIS